jgi:hypothetical protein
MMNEIGAPLRCMATAHISTLKSSRSALARVTLTSFGSWSKRVMRKRGSMSSIIAGMGVLALAWMSLYTRQQAVATFPTVVIAEDTFFRRVGVTGISGGHGMVLWRRDLTRHRLFSVVGELREWGMENCNSPLNQPDRTHNHTGYRCGG